MSPYDYHLVLGRKHRPNSSELWPVFKVSKAPWRRPTLSTKIRANDGYELDEEGSPEYGAWWVRG